MVHIGLKIKEVLHERDMQIVSFAKRINRSRNVVYDIFERQSIDTELLKQISEVLNYDFFKLYKYERKTSETDFITGESLVDRNELNELSLKTQIQSLQQENISLQKEVLYLKKILSLM
jgi:predicted transcriptional regulator